MTMILFTTPKSFFVSQSIRPTLIDQYLTLLDPE